MDGVQLRGGVLASHKRGPEHDDQSVEMNQEDRRRGRWEERRGRVDPRAQEHSVGLETLSFD